MKNWSVTFRNKDGLRETIIVSATDRTSLFAECKKCGINSIIRISECAHKQATNISSANKKRYIKISVAVIFIVAIFIGLFQLLNKAEEPKTVSEVKREITKTIPEKEITSSLEAPKIKPSKSAIKGKGRNAGAKTYIDENGVKRYEGGARVFDKSTITRKPIRVAEKTIFKHFAENQIYALLDIEPGETLFVTRKYDGRFLESFKKSLEEPIELLEDDTERERDLKLAMIETKEDLKKRMVAGEDICKIMEDTYSEIQRLSEYKKEINKMVNESLKKGDLTDADYEDLIKAANMMLEEKGMAPIRNSMLIKRNIILKANRKGTNQ